MLIKCCMCLCLDVNQGGTNCNCCTQTCNRVCTDLLMNPLIRNQVDLTYFSGFWVIVENMYMCSISQWHKSAWNSGGAGGGVEADSKGLESEWKGSMWPTPQNKMIFFTWSGVFWNVLWRSGKKQNLTTPRKKWFFSLEVACFGVLWVVWQNLRHNLH